MGTFLFDMLQSGGVVPALNVVIEKLSSLAETIKLPAIVMFALSAVVAILVGTLGYKYIKLLSTVCFAVVGYALGESLFEVAKAHFDWDVPEFVGTLVGVAVLVLLAILAYKKFAYALFGVACFVGFVLAYFVYPSYILAVAVGVVVAMISMYFVRCAFIIITSFGGGCVLMSMISAMVPDVALLKLDEGFVGKILAIVVSLIFVSVQFYVSRNESKKNQGPKRVKIRRVFDAW